MERKAVSQYSEQTVWRPTIIHPLDSLKSDVCDISENDIWAYTKAFFTSLPGQAAVLMFGCEDKTGRSRQAEPRGDNRAGSIQDLGDSDRPSVGTWDYTKIFCSSQKGPNNSEGISRPQWVWGNQEAG